MFYFQWTVDNKLDSLERRVKQLEKENSRLKSALEDQGILSEYYLVRSNSPNLKDLNRDFKKVLNHLDLHFRDIPPHRKLVELNKESEMKEEDEN